jgi:hypothetical protein
MIIEGKDKKIGVNIMNLSFHLFGGLVPHNKAGVLLAIDTRHTTHQYHDSLNVTTLVVKDHGGSLLIELPEAPSRPAEQGNTILPAVIRVFPFPYRSSKRVLHVRYPKSYQMSAS